MVVGAGGGKFSCLPIIVIIVLLIFFYLVLRNEEKKLLFCLSHSIYPHDDEISLSLSLLLHEEFEEFSHKNKVGCCLMIFDIHSLAVIHCGLGGSGSCDGRGGWGVVISSSAVHNDVFISQTWNCSWPVW